MSKKNFSVLILVLAAVALAVYLVPTHTGREASTESRPFLPQLAAVANDVASVRITANGGSDVVTLERAADGWTVQESYGFPADWTVLRPILADLSQAEVVEDKTANPEYYDRLGVGDPRAENATSKLIEFPGRDDVPGVIVGNRAQGRTGQYLRRADEEGSVLIDKNINLPIDAAGWLKRDIIDIADDEVLAVRISHADGEVVAIARDATDVTDFTLDGIPEGREPKSTWAVNQLASVFSGLKLDAVKPVDEVDWENAADLQLTTADGLVINARLAEEAEHRWIRLEASGTEEADTINDGTHRWAYRIPLYKYDAMNKRMDDLLAEEEGASD